MMKTNVNFYLGKSLTNFNLLKMESFTSNISNKEFPKSELILGKTIRVSILE